MNRRDLLALSGSVAGGKPRAHFAFADVPVPYDWNAMPPMDSRQAFIDWMVKNRGEDPNFLGERFDRFLQLIAHHDVWNDRNKRAYLMTPREDFVTKANLSRAYEWHYLDIGYGVTHHRAAYGRAHDQHHRPAIRREGARGRHRLGLPVRLSFEPHRQDLDDRDHQAALRAHRRRLRRPDRAGLYRIQGHHTARTTTATTAGRRLAPFDKIIVTCGIDHVPPPLLQQLKPNGVMVIPVGPPGAQHVLKIVKEQTADGNFRVARSDIYHGSIVNFVPFTKLVGGKIVGTHNQ